MIQKDIDLQKIQVLDNNFQSFINMIYSLLIGFFIAMLVLFLTLGYQSVFNSYFLIASLIILLFFSIAWVFYFRKKQREHIIFMSKLIQKIENFESLPSLEILKKHEFY